MPLDTLPDGEKALIRESMDALAEAISARDADALMTHYARDVVTFDLRPPQQIRGVGAYRKNFQAWFASVQGRIDYKIHEMHIAGSGGIAFCHSLSHVTSTRTSGEHADYWVRVTSGLRKIGGRWLIVHEHVSMPIDMMSMQAVSDLQT